MQRIPPFSLPVVIAFFVVLGSLVGSCAHQPASFTIQVNRGDRAIQLEQKLYRNWGSVLMGRGDRGDSPVTGYRFKFDLDSPEDIRYAYLIIDTEGVDHPQNPVFLNGQSIGFLRRGEYGAGGSTTYAGEKGKKARQSAARTQRYLPAGYFKAGTNVISFGHQDVRSARQRGRLMYERYTIRSINLAVFKVGEQPVTDAANGKNRVRVFPEQFKFFAALTDEELYIALVKLPSLLAELSDPGSEYVNSLAYVYSRIGDYYRWTGYYKKCLDYQRKAMALQNDMALTLLTPRIRSRLALALYFVGDYQEAVDELEAAAGDIQAIRRRPTATHSEQDAANADRLERLIGAYLAFNADRQGNRSDAEYHAYRIINHFNDDWAYFGNHRTVVGQYVPIALAHQLAGDITLRDGSYKKALAHYRKADTFLSYEPRPEIYNDQRIIIKLGIAKTLVHLKQYEKARRILNSVENPTNAFMWRAYLLRGMMAEDEHHLERAASQYLESIREIEFSRTKLTSHGLKINFMSDKQAPYARMIHCLTQLRQYAEAFTYAEKAKARAFLDLIADTEKIVGQKNDALSELTLEEKRLREMLLDIQHQDDMNRQMFDARGSGDGLSEQIEHARGMLSRFFSRWFKTNKDFASLRSAQTLDVAQVKTLLSKATGLVEYFYDDGHLYAWVLVDDTFRCVVKDVDEMALNDLVRTYRHLMQHPKNSRSLQVVDSRRLATDGQWAEINRRLTRLLVDDVLGGLTCDRIYIVPHGVLHYLPFQALYEGGRYLVERYQIGYAPSASVLGHVFDKDAGKGERLLALGNPDLGVSTMDLSFAEAEVRDIQKVFSDSRVLTRADATESAFKTSADDYDILHVASHGEFNPDQPLLSCLRLRGGDGEDGRLETREIFDLDLNADLIALSACNTGLGKMTSGDEMMGMTRAFIYAGTPSILATFWSVNDASTRKLMTHFYANLKTMDKLRALQEAQVAMIHDAKYHHPYHWAGFQMIGDYQ